MGTALKFGPDPADSPDESAVLAATTGVSRRRPIRLHGGDVSDGLSQTDIDALLSAAAELPADAGGTATAPAMGDGPPVRTMDFTRPSKFNRDQLRTLQMLHEAFCRRASTYLSGTVRALADIILEATEQLPYGDFIQLNPAPNFNAVLELAPIGTNALICADLPLVFSIIDRMLGGQSHTMPRTRELTDIELRVSSTVIENLLYELTQAWSELINVAYRLRGIEMNAQFAQVAAPSEPTVVLSFKVVIAQATGHFALCLPYRSMEKVVGQLTAHRYFSQSDERGGSRDTILRGLRRVSMPVSAVVGEASLPVDTVLDLKPGDVLPLGRSVADGMQLVVGDTPTWRAHPGRDGDHLAVRVERDDAPAKPTAHDDLLKPLGKPGESAA